MNISKKNILEIREFMKNFLNLEYDGKVKLTHEELNNYLTSKKMFHVNHINFNKIKKIDILNGTYILVRDDIGKIIPYQRPTISLKSMLEQIKSQKNTITAKLIRKKYLEEQGYREISTGELLPIEYFEEEPEITQKINRIKVLKNRGIR